MTYKVLMVSRGDGRMWTTGTSIQSKSCASDR